MKKISILECCNIETGERTVLREFEGTIEAPNWLPDGNHILYNSEGQIWNYDVRQKKAQPVDTGYCVSCNNDHVPSPDGRWLGISDSPVTESGWTSRIWVIPLKSGVPEQKQTAGDDVPAAHGSGSQQITAGSSEPAAHRSVPEQIAVENGIPVPHRCDPRLVTENSPSFLHGWSPDGGELAYCAFRGEQVDIYTISAEGGAERRLTDGTGYNDGPEYSPDGRHIWFNSTRTGLMQIFRMNRDGSGLAQMTENDRNNWFPHVSPDGRKVVYLAFRKEDLEPWQHLPDKQVTLWLMDYDGNNKRQIAEVFGGQGTINVNSWAPDGRRFAFVSYRYE